MKRTLTGLLGATCALLLMATSTWAQSGDDILAKAEAAMNAPQDRVATERMTLIEADGTSRDRLIDLYQKGRDSRMVVFREPADVKGVGFLALSEDRMYLYLPAFRKVRRIASSAKNENFMGTDFSYEDMAETNYTESYAASLETEEPDAFVLALKPRPDADVSYAKLRMWVDRKTFIPKRTEYYAADDTLLKVLTAENIRDIDGYWFPTRMTMETVRTRHKTTLAMKTIRHDSRLADGFFTERNLKKQAR